jgi:glycerol-3-phosphate dehydrogenase subunit C
MDRGLRFSPTYKPVELPGRLSEEEWALEAERCHGCGTCRDFCPTAQATDHDLLSSRGRAHLLQALLAGEMDESEARQSGIRNIFESCLGCSQCALHCPTGVDIAPLASLFREAYTPPLTKLRDAFLGSVPSMGYRTGPALGRLVARVSNLAPVRLANRVILGLRRDIAAPEMAASFAFQPGRLHQFPAPGATAKAAYFYGCFGNIYNPGGEAALAVEVLRALGADVVVPAQACCGVSKMARGLLDAVAEDARYTRKSFQPWLEQGYTLVSSAPSCLLALTKEQPRFLPGEGADFLASRSMALSAFILNLLSRREEEGVTVGFGSVPLRLVYQTPCHGAVTGMAKDDVALLRKIPGLEILDVTDECCGMSGSYGAEARRADLSDAVGAPLYARMAAAKPDAVVTPCGSCMTRDAERLGLPVYHPLTLIALSLGLEAPLVVGHSCPAS